jgi:hypothetical protein
MFLDERFDPGAVTWFERIFGAALVTNVGSEIYGGVWHVHAGRFYPWRHLGLVPLYPPAILAIEWLALGACGLALIAGRRTHLAWRIAAPVLLVSVLERYSNHAALLFLVALFVSLSPPAPSTTQVEAERPNLGLVRAQLVIVYVFSALNKLTHGFTRGTSLANLLGLGPSSAPLASIASIVSCGVVVAELAIPALLVLRPRLGIAAVIAMHVAFAAAIPGVASFGLVMTAMAMLFLPPRSQGAASGTSTTLPLALRSWM